MRDRSSSPKPSFRNTKSKFYKKKTVHENDQKPNNNIQSTGDYWKAQGNEELKKGNTKKAIQHYTKAIEMNPGQSVYFSNRARCYKIQGKFIQALKDAQQATQLEQNNIKAHYLCGCILAQLGKKDETKLKKSQNRLKKALRLCSTLKQNTFQLKKLQFLKNEENQKQFYKMQKEIIQKSYREGVITQQLYKNVSKNIQTFNTLVKRQIPDYMLCKITLQLMEQPVMTQEGFSYQKSAIEDHFQCNGAIQPITRKPIYGKIYSNLALKKGIQLFLEQNPWAYEFSECQDFRNIQF